MLPLGKKQFYGFNPIDDTIKKSSVGGEGVSKRECHKVFCYEDLLKKISYLNYQNPNIQIVFRGQRQDYYSNNGVGKPLRSNLYPSMLRYLPAKTAPRKEEIARRVQCLEAADALLKEKSKDQYISKHRLVRWAILQHYEVCATPLLDVTTSLQVALSFALYGGAKEGYLYAIALPHQTGPISVSIETMTQLVDLAKLCPPDAVRPHFQHGLLACDYPLALDTRELIERAPRLTANFSNRLLTKFHLVNVENWVGELFTPTPNSILFPDKRDSLWRDMEEIKEQLGVE